MREQGHVTLRNMKPEGTSEGTDAAPGAAVVSAQHAINGSSVVQPNGISLLLNVSRVSKHLNEPARPVTCDGLRNSFPGITVKEADQAIKRDLR